MDVITVTVPRWAGGGGGRGHDGDEAVGLAHEGMVK
jgi:hypothetical protein